LVNFRKIVRILADKSEYLILRLFENPRNEILSLGKYFGVWLCNNYQWECIIVDDQVEVNENNTPRYCYHTGGQLWVSILEKALVQILGGYQNL
jgi:hypothetical protein